MPYGQGHQNIVVIDPHEVQKAVTERFNRGFNDSYDNEHGNCPRIEVHAPTDTSRA